MGLSHMIILCNWNPLALHSVQPRQLYLVVLQMVQRASKWSKVFAQLCQIYLRVNGVEQTQFLICYPLKKFSN